MTHKISDRPMHIHPVLTLKVNGRQYQVPSQIGIDPRMYHSHKYDKWIGDMGAAPIHTHDSSGVLHVESSITANYNLGDFLDIWGVNLTGDQVSAKADGVLVPNYRKLELKDGERIELDITVPQ